MMGTKKTMCPQNTNIQRSLAFENPNKRIWIEAIGKFHPPLKIMARIVELNSALSFNPTVLIVNMNQVDDVLYLVF